MDLKNKNVLVTGGTHGIGLEIVKFLAKKKCNIAFFSRSILKINKTKKILKKLKVKHYGQSLDILESKKIDFFHENMKKKFGNIDILINNVGGGATRGKEMIEETNFGVWSEVLQKNVLTAAKFIKLCVPHMKKKKWGRVITIASVAAKKNVGRPWYVMAKKAEVTLTKCLSVKKDLVRNGITFNTVSPGAIMIPNTGWDFRKKEDPKKFAKLIKKKFPIGRLGKPQEVANLVGFLCTKEASFINGSDITIDGGQSNEGYED